MYYLLLIPLLFSSCTNKPLTTIECVESVAQKINLDNDQKKVYIFNMCKDARNNPRMVLYRIRRKHGKI